MARLGLPRHLAEWKLSDADLVDAVRPVATEGYPAGELLRILRAAL